MRKIVLLLGTVLAAVLLVGGTALAEPGKNRITSETSSCSNGENYTFTINAMGKAGKLEGTNSNLIIKRFNLTYLDPDSGEVVGVVTYGKGNKKGQQDDLITCVGENTTEIVGFGLVRIVFELEGFITPRGKN